MRSLGRFKGLLCQRNAVLTLHSEHWAAAASGVLCYSSTRNWGTCPMMTCAPAYKQIKQRKRLGRGPNQLVGRGRRGQKIKQGNRMFHRGYEGGSSPLQKKSPRFLWNPYEHNAPLQWLDLDGLQKYLDNGSLYKDRVITIRELRKSGLVPPIKFGLALVNNQKLSKLRHRIHIEVTFVTPSAKRAIEAAGGIVRLKYYPITKIRKFQNPESWLLKQPQSYDEWPRPRWRHMFPDYPQLPVKEEFKYLGKYQVHPLLLPKHVSEEEKQEQNEKLALNDFRPPRPYLLTHTNLKDKLFRWSRYKLQN